MNKQKHLLILALMLITTIVKGQYQVPEYVQNYDPSKPTVYAVDLGGGYQQVADSAAKADLSSDKRVVGMMISYKKNGSWITERYDGPDILNVNWINPIYWNDILISDTLDYYVSNIALTDSLGNYTKRTEFIDSINNINQSQWYNIINGIAYDNNVTVGDTLQIDGIIKQQIKGKVYNDIDYASFESNDTVELSENLTNQTSIRSQYFNIVLDSNQYTGDQDIRFTPYWHNASIYEDSKLQIGYNFQIENYASINDYQHSFKNVTINRANNGDSISLGGAISNYNSTAFFPLNGIIYSPTYSIGYYKMAGAGAGKLYIDELNGLEVDLSSSAATNNIGTSYGINLYGNVNADNQYGIYENFGDNFFTHKITTNDRIETPLLILNDSLLNYVTNGDTIATKEYVDANSGGGSFPSGSNGEIILSDGADGGKVVTDFKYDDIYGSIQLPNVQGVHIGYLAGSALQITTGKNATVGYLAGYKINTGYRNALLGGSAGQDITSGHDNVAIGGFAGENVNTGEHNISIGFYTNRYVIGNDYNIAIGGNAGSVNTASNNLFIGYQAGKSNSSGTPNIFIGHNSGYSNLTGTNNTFTGYESGYLATGSNNTFYGYYAGHGITTGIGNVGIGYYALGATGSTYNVGIGFESGLNNLNTGSVAIGYRAGKTITAARTVAIGYDAGNGATGSTSSIYIGDQAGKGGGSGVYIGYKAGETATGTNHLIGYNSGAKLTTGTNNTMFGYNSGYNNITGSGNVFIGNYAGYNETGSNKLYIENSTSSTPLIYGDFTNDTVRINGTAEITENLEVLGTITNVSQIVTYELLYTDDAVEKTIITLPANSIVLDVGIKINIAFNGTAQNNIDIGTNTVGNLYVDNFDGSSSTTNINMSSLGNLTFTNLADDIISSTNITCEYNDQNNDATAGKATIYIKYVTF